MDSVREKVSEQYKNRKRKILIGLAAFVILLICAFLVEQNINIRLTDVVIQKDSIPEEKAQFIPLRQLDTNIIAVKLSDGSYRLAFDDCTGCYSQFGKHGKFKNDDNNTGLICKNCKHELSYEDMGFLTEESMPYPIYETEITVDEEKFILSVDYLSKHKTMFSALRKGKAINPYSENPN